MPVALPYQLSKTLLAGFNEIQGVSETTLRHFLNTTLNYKYNLMPAEIPAATSKIAYFGIGINGFKQLDDQNLAAPYVPSAANQDLFEPIPFRVVPVDADLSDTERMDYRMRIRRTVDGEDFWCYYLKKITIIDSVVKILETDLTSGVEVEVDTLDPNNLTPTPFTTTAEGAVEATSEISVALTANLKITGAEVVEAITTLYDGNLLRARVSEIGIYMGNDQEIVGDDGSGGSFNYVEAIYAQLAYHYCSLGDTFADPSRIENLRMRIAGASAFLT